VSLIVTHRPSPNFNARKRPISALILHYTGMETGEVAIERLCDPAAGVSAHYVVEEDGAVLQLVAEKDRAWHAGVGQWACETDLNSASIGIEIVNGGHDFGLPPYPDVQIDAVIALCQDILSRHAIAPDHIIGHSDMAPERKEDPGERFPWDRLAENGVGLWPALDAPGDPAVPAAEALADIGYAIEGEGLCPTVITAFQRRFRQGRVDGVLDAETTRRIGQVHQAYRQAAHR